MDPATEREARRRGGRGQTRGATAVEYLVVVGVVALGCLGVIRVFGSTVRHKIEQEAETIASLSQSSDWATRRWEPAGERPAATVATTTASHDEVQTAGAELLTPTFMLGETRPDTPATRLDEAKERLATIPHGQHALELLDAYAPTIRRQPGIGTFYDAGKNELEIDPSYTPDELVSSLVHETTHLEYAKTGKNPDVLRESRAAFVDALLDQEVVAIEREAAARRELLADGDTAEDHAGYVTEYERAADKAIAAAKAKGVRSSAALDEMGKKAGHDRLVQAFKSGEIVTSGGRSYPDEYGAGWDRAHHHP